MAIFRGGKRIGPFDIRLGLPRDKSMQNIDSDPRLSQKPEQESTIGRFRAYMASSNGYARPSRFKVSIFPPTNLVKLGGGSPSLTVGLSGDDGAETTRTGGGGPGMPSALTMHQLSTQMGKQINIHCDSITMPGHDLQVQTIQHGSAPDRDQVVAHGYGGQINASFYADSYLRERHYFEMWQKIAVNHTTHKARYYDDYATGKMQIYQLASDNLQDQPSYAIEAIEVYPVTVSPIEYSYGASNQIVKINVGFNYRRWRNLTDGSITGMDFANSTQTLPDIRARDTGLFGKLPPELQRAGRDIFNQARTQLPIGRLTKGKVFPPFT
jgi:hypothetical protein